MLRAGLKETLKGTRLAIASRTDHDKYNDTVRVYRDMKNACNGIDPTFWGPHVWTAWHAFASNYSVDRKVHYLQFEASLAGLLPCAACRSNFAQTLEQVKERTVAKDPYRNRMEYFYYVYLVHDAVNKKLNKESPSFADVVLEYERHRAD